MGKITTERSQIKPSLGSSLSTKNDSFFTATFSNDLYLTAERGIDFTVEASNSWKSNPFIFSTVNETTMLLDSTMDSGLGSGKSLSPRSPELKLNDDIDIDERKKNESITDPTSVLFSILDIKEDTCNADEPPPSKMPKTDGFNISTLSYISPSTSDSSSFEAHPTRTKSTQNCLSRNVSNIEDVVGTDSSENALVSLKRHIDNNSVTINAVSSFTEEATLGEHDIQNNCETPNLAHLQSTLRALIREVTQAPSGENTSDKPYIGSARSNSSLGNSDTVDSTNISAISSRFSNIKTSPGSLPKKEISIKKSILCATFPCRKKDGSLELRILSQPEEQHRARYLTEGSRGAVKDRRGTGFPTVKLFGYNKPVNLQVFIGTDQGRIQPHLFYQASQVCGKNSTPCSQTKIDGTTVLEITMLPDKDMTVCCDCVGILKERNVDVEQRLLNFGGIRSKKRSTRCRVIFRVSVPLNEGVETLQVASAPIICTQPPGVPEICRVSLSSCSVKGDSELFIIGKNFLKDAKVIFREVLKDSQNDGRSEVDVCWKAEAEPEKEYLQPTHLICWVPPYHKLDVVEAVKVQLLVQSGDKLSEPYPFTYVPLPSAVNQQAISIVSQELPLGVAAPAVEINQPFNQTGNVPTIIQLPILTTAAKQLSTPQDLIVIPTGNPTLISNGSSSIPTTTVHVGSPLITGCTDTPPGQVQPTQLQLIVVQSANTTTTTELANKVQSPLKEFRTSEHSTNIQDTSFSIKDNISKNIFIVPSDMENESSLTIPHNELNKLDLMERLEEKSSEISNQQRNHFNKSVEDMEVNSRHVNSIQQNNLNTNNQNTKDLEENSSFLINEWQGMNNICTSVSDCQVYCYNNNSNSSINKNFTKNETKSQESSVDSELCFNGNNGQTLRDLLLQGRTNTSQSFAIENISMTRNEILSPLNAKVDIQSMLVTDQTSGSIITNQQPTVSEPSKPFSSQTDDFLTNTYTFTSDTANKQNSEQFNLSSLADNLNDASAISSDRCYEKQTFNNEINENFGREFLCSSLKNDLNKCKNNILKNFDNKISNEPEEQCSKSFPKFSSMGKQIQSDTNKNNFSALEDICHRSIVTEHQDSKGVTNSLQNEKVKVSQGMTTNFTDLQTSGSNVDHFSAITMLPEMELLSMINPSTFDNV